ncbi:MAG: glycosyltransferase, partial [Anaerolineae bacterium]|nr:glycosyltransferase [Anaerolineae bacterium]
MHLIRNNDNLGFSAGNNVGLQRASGKVLVLLNQDTVVQPGWLSALVA